MAREMGAVARVREGVRKILQPHRHDIYVGHDRYNVEVRKFKSCIYMRQYAVDIEQQVNAIYSSAHILTVGTELPLCDIICYRGIELRECWETCWFLYLYLLRLIFLSVNYLSH